LKKLFKVLSEETSDSSNFLNVIWLLKYILNRENSIFHFSYFDPDYPTSRYRHSKLSSEGCNVCDGRQVKQVQSDNTASLPLKFQKAFYWQLFV
jgi:hypothetical protein